MQDGQNIDQMIPNPNQAGKDTENTSERVLGSWRALWAYSAKRAARDNTTLTAQQRRAIDAIEGAKPARRPRFVSQGRKGMTFDQASFERAQRLVGLKGYITNIPAHISAGSEIIGHYHELWHVEQSFRMSKHDLKARPILSSTPGTPSTPSLTFVTAALAISRHLQATTGITTPKLVDKLIDLQEIDITLPDGHTYTAHPEVTEETQKSSSYWVTKVARVRSWGTKPVQARDCAVAPSALSRVSL